MKNQRNFKYKPNYTSKEEEVIDDPIKIKISNYYKMIGSNLSIINSYEYDIKMKSTIIQSNMTQSLNII